MRVIVTGGTGLIGTVLVNHLHERGDEVIVLSRTPVKYEGRFPAGVRLVAWDTRTARGWGHLINADTAIVNLAGESVANWRWTNGHKERVRQSRLDASRAMLDAVKVAEEKPAVLLQASAVGYYGARGQETLSEYSPGGEGWRADVCSKWEELTEPVESVGVRRCLLRIGIVMDTRSGALPPMVLATRMFGNRIGSGRQWVPWIHNDDVTGAITYLMDNPQTSGAYNLVSPYPVTNQTLMHHIGQVLHWPTTIPVPAAALRLALGEMSATVLASQRVHPARLLEAGYSFHHEHIESALRDLLQKSK